MRQTLIPALMFAALCGCLGTGEVTYSGGVSGGAYVSSPDLVTVSPGVQVVADYDEPVFYTDGFYWRFYDNGWYRSNDYASGWIYWNAPPVYLTRIDRPYAYAHYRPAGYVVRDHGGARYRPAAPIVRDHGGGGGTVVRDHGYRNEVVRDHGGAPPAAQPYRPAAPPPARPAAPPARRAPTEETRDHRHK